MLIIMFPSELLSIVGTCRMWTQQDPENANSSQQDTGQDSYKVKAGGEEAECTAKEKNQHILIFGHCTRDGRCEQQPATTW